jgi:isoleucyl-tRNA synthetase
MLPQTDESRLNARAEQRFKTLQTAVVLARVARERRRIRNNLPLKSVLVVCANAQDAEALEYLNTYFVSEINAWDVVLSADWEKYCTLSVSPNWKDLGKRLGKEMKAVAAVIEQFPFIC